jgi:hypothetical protein
VLEVADLDWDGYRKNSDNNCDTVRCLRVSDGDLLYYKDNTEPLKKLSSEEYEAIKKEELKRWYISLPIFVSLSLPFY